MVVALIYILCFLDIFSFGLLLPILPVHVLSIGGSRFLLGVLASLHALLQLSSGPLVGSWSDSVGRKRLLFYSFFFCFLSNLLLTFTSSLSLYIVSRVLLGLSCHIQILTKALLTDNVPKENQNAAFAKIGAIMGISFIIGPILGAVLHTNKNGFFYIGLILSGASLIGIGFTRFLPDTVPKRSSKQKKLSLLRELSSAFINLQNIKWNIFWDVFVFKFLVESSFSAFFSTFGIILIDLYGASQQQMASVLSFFSMLTVVANISFGKIKQNVYKEDLRGFQRNMHCFVGMSLVFAVMYLGASFWTYVLMMIPLAFTRVILDATWMEMLISRIPESEKGTVMGSYESVVQISSLATPVITGYVGEVWGYGATPPISIIPVAIGSFIVNYCYKKNTLVDIKSD